MLRGLVGLSILLLPALAQAQIAGQPYVSESLGANIAGSMTSSGQTFKIDTDTGPAGAAALGWVFDNKLRAELEGSVRSNGLSGISSLRANGQLLPETEIGGSLRTYAVMANLAYDIDPNDLSLDLGIPLHPYVGAGLGYGWLQFVQAHSSEPAALFHLPFHDTFVGPATVRYGTGSAFAYQALAGASLPLDCIPGLEATLEYRFFGTARADIEARARTTLPTLVNGSVPAGQRLLGFVAHENIVLVGLRYRFDADFGL